MPKDIIIIILMNEELKNDRSSITINRINK